MTGDDDGALWKVLKQAGELERQEGILKARLCSRSPCGPRTTIGETFWCWNGDPSSELVGEEEVNGGTDFGVEAAKP